MTGAGDLRTIVRFDRLTETADGYGGRSNHWSTVATTNCQFRAKSGRETLETGRIEATATATLRCRGPSVVGIDESCRATLNGVQWNIRSVIPFGQRGEWVDMVVERAGAGVAT